MKLRQGLALLVVYIWLGYFPARALGSSWGAHGPITEKEPAMQAPGFSSGVAESTAEDRQHLPDWLPLQR